MTQESRNPSGVPAFLYELEIVSESERKAERGRK